MKSAKPRTELLEDITFNMCCKERLFRYVCHGRNNRTDEVCTNL